MRSFASLLVVIALGASSSPDVRAETPVPRTIYTETLLQERSLRQEIESTRGETPPQALLERMRAIVEKYERLSRQFPTSAYIDNALWQAALLSADAFWTYGESEDKAEALELFSELNSRFPKSPLLNELPSHVKRLREAKFVPRPVKPAAPPAPVLTSARATNALTAVKREVLPDALRITLEMGEEVTFRSDRLDSPPRVFIDFENTRPVEAIKDATIPFPDDVVAEKTWVQMFETQLEAWTKTPLVTNTQPDFSRVGNSELLDRTVRSHNWIRTDTIFIENEQIEPLSNRPPWLAAICESGMPGDRTRLLSAEGLDHTENILEHVLDVGANYWSLWNFHNISATSLRAVYEARPEFLDRAARRIGYRIRPSWIWSYEKDGHPGLVLGLVNDGVACVPGTVRLTVFNEDGTVTVSGCLDPGYPMTRGVRQAMLPLPKGTDWKGLRLKAELALSSSRTESGAIDCAGESCFPNRSSASLRGKYCSLSTWTSQMERPFRPLPSGSAWQVRRSAGG